VLDAVDSVTPKVAILQMLSIRQIPVVSSMGAGWKSDPLYIKIGDISDTTVCPVAVRIRRQLRKQGINSGITCIYSTEPPQKAQLPLIEAEEEYCLRGRDRRAIGSISYMTGIFGYMTARTVLQFILEN